MPSSSLSESTPPRHPVKIKVKKHPRRQSAKTAIKREESPETANATLSIAKRELSPADGIPTPPKKRARNGNNDSVPASARSNEDGWDHPDELDYVEPGWDQDKTVSFLLANKFSVPERPGHSTALVKIPEFGGSLVPARYRIPLMWVARYMWESLHLVLNAADRDGEWDSFRWSILHLSRLCTHLIESAKKMCEDFGIDRKWRCPAFDRALVRFKAKWLIPTPEHVQSFWESFGEKEFENDVLMFSMHFCSISNECLLSVCIDWKPWALKGYKGFRVTEDELMYGITADAYVNGLKNVAGRWTWYGQPKFTGLNAAWSPSPTPPQNTSVSAMARASASASAKPQHAKVANKPNSPSPMKRRRLPDINKLPLPAHLKPAQSASATALSYVSIATPGEQAAAGAVVAATQPSSPATTQPGSSIAATDVLIQAFTSLTASIDTLRKQNEEQTAELKQLRTESVHTSALNTEIRELRNEMNMLRMARSYDCHSHVSMPAIVRPGYQYQYQHLQHSQFLDPPATNRKTPTLFPVGSFPGPPLPATPELDMNLELEGGGAGGRMGRDRSSSISTSLGYPDEDPVLSPAPESTTPVPEVMPASSPRLSYATSLLADSPVWSINANTSLNGDTTLVGEGEAGLEPLPKLSPKFEGSGVTAAIGSMGPVKNQRKMIMMGLNGLAHCNG
jgi:hypothetical protein